ncbi:unnamed protein product [Polarella glacialis]|uniref:LITAF domain-containing protein n=1 Tax=Polarella glacialis TaxID=89957 RepID=A0A813LB68_POLGL|nr:unnamed protein product [Polarella glacialis]CAE8722892.1 unnamed protein product [Polarella glacialis]
MAPQFMQQMAAGQHPSQQQMAQQVMQQMAAGQHQMAAGPHGMPQVVLENGFGDSPQPHGCQFCGVVGQTRVNHIISTGTVVACVCVACFFPCGCCLIAYCMKCSKEAQHSCTSCGQLVGRKQFEIHTPFGITAVATGGLHQRHLHGHRRGHRGGHR